MLKYILYFIVSALVVGLIIGGLHLYRVSIKNKKEMAQYTVHHATVQTNFGKALVVYYSLSGNTRDIAKRIAEKTNADMYEIKTAEALPQAPKLHLTVKQQLKSKEYPTLSQDIPDMENYDVIFVGSPIWWYTAATPVLSFLNQTDFKGKRVIPFSTQGSNVGTYFEDFADNAKNAILLEGASFNNIPNSYSQAVDNKIASWLNDLPVN